MVTVPHKMVRLERMQITEVSDERFHGSHVGSFSIHLYTETHSFLRNDEIIISWNYIWLDRFPHKKEIISKNFFMKRDTIKS
jgi:hypothetical protein